MHEKGNTQKTIFILLLLFVISGPLAALGKQDSSEYQEVDGKENWQKTIDLSEAEPGEYNLLVKAVDSAGNVGHAGPYNIVVDPDSSIPGVSISYPVTGERLGTSFSVVGVAWDDDEVEKVVLAVDEGEFESVQGTKFWSWHYERQGSAQALGDGPHILRVRARDIDGNTSPEISLEVNIDTATPDFTIDTPEAGAVVSGKIEIEGFVQDENGIRKGAVSWDGGKEEEKLSLKKDKDSTIYRFSHTIDTRDLEDGPRLVNLKAEDNTGSTGGTAFLLFVDNAAPEISFLYPGEEELNGNFTVVGRAEDAVGIEALTFRADNGQEGRVELKPGNSLWMQSFDYSGIKSGKKKITFQLSDTAGNSIKEEISFRLNRETDLPRLFCSEYSGEALTFAGTPVFSGWAEDDDGPVAAIEYMVEDLTPWEKIDSTGTWSLSLTDFSAGEGVLKLRAIDRNGTTGETVSIPFSVLPPPGKIFLENLIVEAQGATAWRAGRIFAYGEKAELQGRLEAFSPGTVLYYRFDEGDERKIGLDWNDEKNSARFSIKLSEKETAGRHDLYMRLHNSQQAAGRSDSAQADFRTREVTAHTAWYREAPADENGLVQPLTLEEELLFDTPEETSLSTLFEGMELQGWIAEGDIRSISLDPEIKALRVEKEGRFFSLLPVEEAVIPRFTLEVESKTGVKFSFPVPGLRTDETPPRISLKSPGSSQRMKNTVLIAGEVKDKTEAKTLRCTISLPNEADASPRLVEIELQQIEGQAGAYRFEREINLPGEERTGPVQFRLQTSDAAGNRGIKLFTLLQDSKAPEFHLIVPKGTRPANSDWANEQTLVCGYVRDGSEVSAVQVGEDSFPLEHGFFAGQVNFSGMESLPDSLNLQAKDQLDNVNNVELPLVLDIDRWKPQVRVYVPAEGEAFTESFRISGSAVDREGIDRVEYKINDGEWKTNNIENTFSIPISLSELKADQNSITVRAVDINGYTSDEVMRKFRLSLQEPKISVEKPALGEVVRGKIELTGPTEDENGIKKVGISFDNGNTFQNAQIQEAQADGPSVWSYKIDSTLLANGTNPILLHVEDEAGVDSYYSSLLNVDNSPPEVEIRSPGAGEFFYNSIHLEGRVHDSVEVKSIKISLNAVNEASAETETMENETADEATKEAESTETGFAETESVKTDTGVLLKYIDISELPRGKYLFNMSVQDGAGNSTDLSRPIELHSPQPEAPVFILPLPGDEPGPFFTVEGKIPQVNMEQSLGTTTKRVSLLIDGNIHSLIDVGDDGRFHSRLGPEDGISPGVHELSLRWEHKETIVESEAHEIRYHDEGLWINTDSIHFGDHVGDLFTITGTAGYFEGSPADFESKKEEKEYQKELEDKQPSRVEISFDEGRSFLPIRGTEAWSYRIYRQNHPEGEVRALLRARSESEMVYTRLIFTVDTSPPQIDLYEKIENGRFNNSLYVSGHAFDESGLTDLQISLRPGDKNSYSTPSFIQGMYFDATALGATWFTSGLGMTFMDDNVKLQVQYGYAPEGYTDPETGTYRTARFGGQVLGSKLLANILYIPYDYFLGPKYQQLSASFALGANFSYFNNPGAEESWGIILAGVTAQLEFLKYEFRDRRFLKYISAFAEGQVWLISSDVEPDVAIMPSFGLRLGLF